MNYQIIPATAEEINCLDEKIIAFNKTKVDKGQKISRKNYVIKNDEKVIAGISTIVYHFCLYIDVLFVDEEYRFQKLGSKLLLKIENDAKELDLTLIHLDTFDFQAKDFYLKHGYEVFGILDGSPMEGHKRYYLSKKL